MSVRPGPTGTRPAAGRGSRGRTGTTGGGRRTSGAVRGTDTGAVTAEVAIALPAVVLVLAVLLVTAAATAAQLRCADGARAGARLAALGEPDAAVVVAARRVAGGSVDVAVSRGDPWVEVTVRSPGPGAWFTGGGIAVAASATAWVEP